MQDRTPVARVDEPEVQGQIPGELLSLDKRVHQLRELHSKLCDRLEPVLRAGLAADGPQKNVVPVPSVLCGVAQRIYDVDVEIDRLVRSTEDVLQRLEV
jgi:hypothetical protein